MREKKGESCSNLKPGGGGVTDEAVGQNGGSRGGEGGTEMGGYLGESVLTG